MDNSDPRLEQQQARQRRLESLVAVANTDAWKTVRENLIGAAGEQISAILSSKDKEEIYASAMGLRAMLRAAFSLDGKGDELATVTSWIVDYLRAVEVAKTPKWVGPRNAAGATW